ncbi:MULTISPECIES: sulfotransferase [unclassified Cyanobium]|jgi:hypothetical protein|uniref:sulfotransferase n=1 Tax=unclassified Cyanobium TaxID=2627006 RepID=UPI0020CF55C5|nr:MULTISPECIES: sulfotransferase [unclassified Cyanobium]
MDRQAVLAFHYPHKTGSMFGYEILKKLSAATGAPFYSPNNQPANHQKLAEAVSQYASGLVLRGPVRDFELTDERSLDTANLANETPVSLFDSVEYYAVCQVRDPLDLVVSQYFSHGWIHAIYPSIDAKIREDIQAGKISIYDYAVMEFRGESGFGEASILQKYHHLTRLKDLLGGRCLILRYEDMVLNYPTWSRQMSDFLRPLAEARALLASLRPDYGKFRRKEGFWIFGRKQRFWSNPLDYVEQEMRKVHIRSPLPGDHLNFLTPAEISSLRSSADQFSGKP